MNTLTIPINERSRELLLSLAEKTGQSTADVLDKALHAYRRQVFFSEVNAGYASLRADPNAWDEHESERKKLDAAMSDGLDSENWTEDGTFLSKE